MIANWQELAVAIIAVVVAIALVRRVWRFFFCNEGCSCSECNKECNRRKVDK
ncbi:MAG: hypothetical protein IIU78_04280 [Alistipes sp.]|nr:hypothetical protein [Alistipes sp.]